MTRNDIKDLLDYESKRINNPDFIEADPVQFPRRFERLQDIETVAFLSAMIAWGNRKMICRNCEKMLGLMDYQPYSYIKDKGYEELDPGMNIHRTFFGRDMQYFLRGMNWIYSKYGSLDEFAAAMKVGQSEFASWNLADAMQSEMAEANGGAKCSRCLPVNLKQTALKRINMALRWLVRDDGIVDMGVWKSIPKSGLYIPLDVHVGNVSRELGLLSRKSNDRQSVEQLTETLRSFRPDDPVVYDYALFGIGVAKKQGKIPFFKP